MENNFAQRLIAARKMAGLSLQGLADKLENIVSKQSLNKYEQGKMMPDSSLIIKLSDIFNLPANYFYSAPAVAINFEHVEFRKYNSKLKAKEQEAVLERAKEKYERYFELENTVGVNDEPQYFKYDKLIETQEDAEDAANELRKEWNLGYDPIPDVVEMLEDKGYKVIEIDALDAFDGMKADIGERKAIVLRKTEQDEDIVRKRFTALHELAHHALKFPDGMEEKQHEKLCHAFSSALLYPAEMAVKEMSKNRFHFYQNELVLIKERWGISFTALFSRALQLKIINQNVYKRFNIGYKKRGLHIKGNEPGRFLAKERPVKIERLVYIGLAKEILTINEAAYFSGTSSWKLRSQMNQMV